jgi:hypothetical protein
MPDFHHRHHAAQQRAANFASLFPWIDATFGTHDDTTAAEYRVDEPMPQHFLALLICPWWRTPSATKTHGRGVTRTAPDDAGASFTDDAELRSRSSRTPAAA